MSTIENGPTTYRGIVRHFTEQQVLSQGYKTWQFLIEQQHKENGELRHIPVKLVGRELIGVLMEGNEVEIIGSLENGNLIPDTIRNISLNNSEIRVQQSCGIKLLKIILICMAAMTLLAIGAMTLIVTLGLKWIQ